MYLISFKPEIKRCSEANAIDHQMIGDEDYRRSRILKIDSEIRVTLSLTMQKGNASGIILIINRPTVGNSRPTPLYLRLD